MNIHDIVNIIFVVISLVLVLVSAFYHGKSKVFSKIAGLILDAESTYGAGTGSVKMTYVVGELYNLLPAVIRPFLPQALLQTIVQAVFDNIQYFAQMQIKQLEAKKDDGINVGTSGSSDAASNAQTGATAADQVQQVTSGLPQA